MNSNYPNQKPGLVTAIAVMTLISGIINLFWGYIASASALGTIVGIVCLPITILPTILGVFEIIYAAKLLSAQPQPVQPSTSLAVFQILTFLIGNIFSLVVGILTLIFYNDKTVADYFARLNGVMVYAPQAASPVVEPMPESLSASTDNEVVVENESVEQPAKPKRTRKVTGK
jgi:hypothetical protein